MLPSDDRSRADAVIPASGSVFSVRSIGFMPFDIAARVEAWRAHLLDTTKRNRLINFKTGRAGGITFAHPGPGDLWHLLVAEGRPLTFPWKGDLIDLPAEREEAAPDDGLAPSDPPEAPAFPEERDVLEGCLRSPRLRPDHLLTDLPDRQLASRLTRLALNARESLTEQGVTVLYVAFGFLRWFESAD